MVAGAAIFAVKGASANCAASFCGSSFLFASAGAFRAAVFPAAVGLVLPATAFVVVWATVDLDGSPMRFVRA